METVNDSGPMVDEARKTGTGMALALRIVAAVLAAFWALPLFAVVDLATALSWREGWEDSLLLEASWGALLTFFVVVPLLVVVVRPGRHIEAGLWSGVTAVSLVAGTIITGEATALWPALFAAVTGGIVVALGLLAARRRAVPRPARPRVQASWLLGLLALVGIPLWLAYAASTAAVPAGAPTPYLTNGIDHWPVQAASGIAVILASAIAAIFADWRALAAWAAALSAAVIGVIMALSQEFPVATESPLWCIGAVLWAALLALALHAAPYTASVPASAAPAGEGAAAGVAVES